MFLDLCECWLMSIKTLPIGEKLNIYFLRCVCLIPRSRLQKNVVNSHKCLCQRLLGGPPPTQSASRSAADPERIVGPTHETDTQLRTDRRARRTRISRLFSTLGPQTEAGSRCESTRVNPQKRLCELSAVRHLKKVSGAQIAKVVFEAEEKMKPPVELEVRQQSSDYIQPSTEVNIH